MKDLIRRLKSSKIFRIAFIIVAILGLYLLFLKPKSVERPVKTATPQSETAKPLSQVGLNKSFVFSASLYKAQGNENINFILKSAELKNEIKVKDEPRKAKSDRLYLLLRLELENESAKRLTFASADFIRLLDREGKKFAPDFHNATIIIDPISVKRDLISFIVDKSQKSFSLSVGTPDGEKERVEINF